MALRSRGSSFPKLSFSQGFADGYMRALLDAKLATTKELLAIVAEERAALGGPAVRDEELESMSDARIVPTPTTTARDDAPTSGVVARRLSRAVA